MYTSLRRHVHIFSLLLLPLLHSCFLIPFSCRLHHGHVLQKEGDQNGGPTENEDRYETVLDGDGEREPERLEYLVQQVLYLLHDLGCHPCRDLIVLRASRNARHGVSYRETLRRVHYCITVC